MIAPTGLLLVPPICQYHVGDIGRYSKPLAETTLNKTIESLSNTIKSIVNLFLSFKSSPLKLVDFLHGSVMFNLARSTESTVVIFPRLIIPNINPMLAVMTALNCQVGANHRLPTP
jgi:hypothetical protein